MYKILIVIFICIVVVSCKNTPHETSKTTSIELINCSDTIIGIWKSSDFIFNLNVYNFIIDVSSDLSAKHSIVSKLDGSLLYGIYGKASVDQFKITLNMSSYFELNEKEWKDIKSTFVCPYVLNEKILTLKLSDVIIDGKPAGFPLTIMDYLKE